MPTYAYRCASCGHAFEQFQRMSDDALTECPECEGRINRVIFPVGVVFKGSGWYINDSRESKNGNAKSAKAETTETTEKSDDKGDKSKAPTAKDETKPKKTEAKSAAD